MRVFIGDSTPHEGSAISGRFPVRSLAPPVTFTVMDDRSARSGLRILESPGAGRGVFADRSFAAGDILEVAPALVIPPAQIDALRQTGLRYYVWNWGSSLAVGLGIISLVNHGIPANTKWVADFENGELSMVATADIEPGDELLVDYSKGGTRPLPFADRSTND